MLRELLRTTLDAAILNQYGMTVVRTMTDFPARWYTKGDLLFVSPDLRGEDLPEIEDHLCGSQSRVLRLVPVPREASE